MWPWSSLRDSGSENVASPAVGKVVKRGGKKQKHEYQYNAAEIKAFRAMRGMKPDDRKKYVKAVANNPEQVKGYKNAVARVRRDYSHWF